MSLKETRPSIELCITDFCSIRSKVSCEGKELIHEVLILNYTKHVKQETLMFVTVYLRQIEQYLRAARRIVNEAKER